MLITRKEAMSRGLKRYYTGKPCTAGHNCERYVNHWSCVMCSAARAVAWRKDNHKQWVATSVAWSKANSKRHKQNQKSWQVANKDRMNSYRKKWRDNNPVKRAAFQYRLKEATPGWANLDKIEEIYRLRDTMTTQTGVPHEVDHIIPLHGEYVCGLHVENNLQVLPAALNKSKNNKFVPIVESLIQ